MPEFTRYKKRISHRFSHRLSHGEKNPVTLLDAGSLTARSFSAPRRPPPPGGVSGLCHPRCMPPTFTFFPLLTFFSFLLYIPFFQFLLFFFFSFFCISLSAHFSFPFLLCVSLCSHIASLPERNSINCCRLYFRAYACLYILFFLLLRCICLAAYFFFISGYPCVHILFFMHTLACIFNFTKCICLPDVVYFFCVYLYVCILLLEVYIQGCVFI